MPVTVARTRAEVVTALALALDGGPAVLPEPTEAALLPAAVDEPVDDDIALLVPTSGSTRAPKIVEVPRAALVASARATEEVLGGPGRWLLCLPTGYIAGIQVIVRALLAGAPPVLLPDAPFRAAAFARAAGALDGDRRYVSVVPTQLTRLLDDAEGTAALRSFAGVLVGGAATPAPLADRARAAGVAIRTTYGMSETSGGCVYDGMALPGVSVDVDPDSRIRLGGPTLARRYRHDEAATAAAFVDERFVTSDVGRLDDDGRLHVLGRVDDVINTGGRKVLTLEIAAAASTCTGVADVFVAGVPDPEWGAVVTAWVVPAAGVDASTVVDEVHEAVRRDVGAVAVPRRIEFVKSIPLLPTGKPDRLRLLGELSS